MSQNAPELEATDARQGRRSGRMIVVLATAIALVVIAFAAIWAARYGQFTGKGGETTASAQVAQSTNTVPNAATTRAGTAPAGSVAAQASGQNAHETAGG